MPAAATASTTRTTLHVKARGYLRSGSRPDGSRHDQRPGPRGRARLDGVTQIETCGMRPLTAQLDHAVVDPAAVRQTRGRPVEHVDRGFGRDADTRRARERVIGIANRRRPKPELAMGLDAIRRFLRVHIDEPEPHASVGIQRSDTLDLRRRLVRDGTVRASEDERGRSNALLRAQRVHRASIECAAVAAAPEQHSRDDADDDRPHDFAENLSADDTDYTDSQLAGVAARTEVRAYVRRRSGRFVPEPQFPRRPSVAPSRRRD